MLRHHPHLQAPGLGANPAAVWPLSEGCWWGDATHSRQLGVAPPRWPYATPLHLPQAPTIIHSVSISQPWEDVERRRTFTICKRNHCPSHLLKGRCHRMNREEQGEGPFLSTQALSARMTHRPTGPEGQAIIPSRCTWVILHKNRRWTGKNMGSPIF